MTLRTYLLSHVAYNALEHAFPSTADPMRILNEAFTFLATDAEITNIVEENFANAFDNNSTLH